MKVSFIILLCFALIFGIFAGCTGTSSTAASTTETSTSGTSTVYAPSNGIDPILGSWINNTDIDPTENFYITFSQTGNIIASNHNYKEDIGDWNKNQDNSYSVNLLINDKSSNYTFIYDKNTDTLHLQGYPEDIIYRIGKTPKTTQTIPAVTRTKVVTATPTQDNYQYCRDTYPGSSYNPSTNKCVYPTTVSTKTPTRTPTQIVKNDIANAKFCFLKALATSDRDQFPSDPPLVHEGFWAVASSSTFKMPIKPGNYNILLTTLNPEATVDLYISYDNFTMKDKFGNSVYRRDKFLIGSSNRYTDLNQDINIPADSVNGIINIYQPTEYWLHNDNCGRLIVTAI